MRENEEELRVSPCPDASRLALPCSSMVESEGFGPPSLELVGHSRTDYVSLSR